MDNDYLEAIPFGNSISSADILDNFEFLDDWEQRYRFIIDLGKQLPEMPEQYQMDENKIFGCQSQVWIVNAQIENQHYFGMDSDALIVRGLICIVLSAFNRKSNADILNFNIEDYFSELDLAAHLSMQRGNGLRAMVERVRLLCREQAD